jgi:hypothetical protein
MNVADLRRKARRGTLEVEHLLDAAVARVPHLSEELQQLASEHGWKTAQEIEPGEAPLATWATVAAAYAEGGLEGLHVFHQMHAPFCVALLEEIKSESAVQALLTWWPEALSNETTSELAWRIASALNFSLSFKAAPSISEEHRESVREFAYRLYRAARTEVHRATALLVLRGVGDEQSLAFVAQADEFEGAWASTRQNVTTAIRRRLRKD